MQRVICHVDMDAFFVSVEEVFNPSLRGKPVIIGGQPNQRGVVAAASYAARKFGIHSAMPLRTAGRLCPKGIYLPGNMGRYREYSRKVHAVLTQFSPQVEMASIDEAYVDLTGTTRLLGPPLLAAHKLHQAIGEQVGLRCSIGLASSRLVAKICSDQAKPNGMVYVLAGNEARFLAPLEVRTIPGVGKQTEASLHRLGIHHVGDLANLDASILESHFGKWGLALAGKAQGEDAGGWFDAEVGGDDAPKSISHEHTFSEDTANPETLETAILKLSEMVARRLRQNSVYARTLHLKLRDEDFQTVTRAQTLDHATQLDPEISSAAMQLFRATWDRRKPLRLIGIYAGNLQSSEGQMNLLEEPQTQRLRDALRSVDRIRGKFGDAIISTGKTVGGPIRERVHDNPHDLPGQKSSK